MAARRLTSSRSPASRDPIAGAHVVILDADAATGLLLRRAAEDRGAASAEVVADVDEALDVLGNGSKPVSLLMMDTLTGGGHCVQLLRVLRNHNARVHVTLHGRFAPEQYAVPGNLEGAAAYTHLATSSQTLAAAADVMRTGRTVRAIADDRVVPDTLDPASALAIYGAAPGQSFPITLRM